MSRPITTVTATYDYVDNFLTGSTETTSSWHPTHGNQEAWYSDVDWWWDNGLITNEKGGTFNGKNGKSHTENLSIGFGGGRYPGPEMIGCKFQFSQNSTAGHSLYMKRYGFLFEQSLDNQTISDTIFWSSQSYERRNDYDWHWVEFLFPNYITEDYRFCALRIQASSEGGTGTRETQLQIRNFRPKWRIETGSALIIQPYRTYAARFDKNCIA